jgi:hypothetical protein
MDNFLKNQFVNLTQTDFEQINSYYPAVQQFPGKGAFWRAAANAYGEMRYTCPGIYISTMISTHGQPASYNYRYVQFHQCVFKITDISKAGTCSPRETLRTA